MFSVGFWVQQEISEEGQRMCQPKNKDENNVVRWVHESWKPCHWPWQMDCKKDGYRHTPHEKCSQKETWPSWKILWDWRVYVNFFFMGKSIYKHQRKKRSTCFFFFCDSQTDLFLMMMQDTIVKWEGIAEAYTKQ